MENFKRYLGVSLEKIGLDAALFVDYFFGMLEEGMSVSEFEGWIDELSADKKRINCLQLWQMHKTPSLLLGAFEEENHATLTAKTPASPAELPLVSELRASSREFIPKGTHIVDIPGDVSELESLVGDIDLDLDLDEEEPSKDWVTLAISLEEFMLGLNIPMQFSNEALCQALFQTNGRIEAAAGVLVTTNAILEQYLPCRHMLSGGCFRRDCSFEHNVSGMTCRYWLSSVGCLSPMDAQGQSTCPFFPRHSRCRSQLSPNPNNRFWISRSR